MKNDYRLTVYPDYDGNKEKSVQFFFETKQELNAASDSTGDMLLFLQDELKLMPDHPNLFVSEKLIDGEWEEPDEFGNFSDGSGAVEDEVILVKAEIEVIDDSLIAEINGEKKCSFNDLMDVLTPVTERIKELDEVIRTHDSYGERYSMDFVLRRLE
jgi:hypothetical protein